MPRIVAVADLHTHLPQIPPCDLLVVAGDVCSIFTPADAQERFLRGPFSDWLRAVPAEAIAGVSGNHELVRDEVLASLPWCYLAGDTAELAGLRVFGLPWTSRFADFPYQDAVGRPLPDRLPPRLAAVPDGLDVLISHEPPAGAGDQVAGGSSIGSEPLAATLRRARPRLCVVGHIHSARGVHRLGETVVANVALAGESDRPAHPPAVIDL